MPRSRMWLCMKPEDAVKQVEYVMNTKSNEASAEVAPKYKPAFRRVEANGGATEVGELARQVCAEIRAGSQPTPAAATSYADSLVDDERLLTDGRGA